MPMYQVDIPVWATVYIKADSEDEAREILQQKVAAEPVYAAQDQFYFDGRPIDVCLEDPVYDWALSPVMTIASWEYFEDDVVIDEA